MYGTFAMSVAVPADGCRGQDLRCSLHLRFACDCSSCILHGFGFAVYGIRPCATAVVVRCPMLPDGPPREKDYIGINSTGFQFLAVVVSFWIARVDRCLTDSPRDAPRLGRGGRIFLRKDSRCRDRGYLEMQQNQ